MPYYQDISDIELSLTTHSRSAYKWNFIGLSVGRMGIISGIASTLPATGAKVGSLLIWMFSVLLPHFTNPALVCPMQWSNKAILYNNCYANLVPLLAHVILFFMCCSFTIRRSHTCYTLLNHITKQTSNDKWSYNHIVCIIYHSALLTGRSLPELLLASRNIGWDSEKWKGASLRISYQQPIEQGHRMSRGRMNHTALNQLMFTCIFMYLQFCL